MAAGFLVPKALGAVRRPDLAGRFTAFGRCGSAEVIDRIAKVPASGAQSRPRHPSLSESVRVELGRG